MLKFCKKGANAKGSAKVSKKLVNVYTLIDI